MKSGKKGQSEKIKEHPESRTLAKQPCWSFVKELNSCSDERLNSTAVRDGFRKYTYRQMFRYWKRYAEAFSGVQITGKTHSRVALIGTPLTETVFAFYGLNMTGACVSLIHPVDLFDEEQLQNMIEKEEITDLLISELYAFPRLMERLLHDREALGLRNIIVLESPMGGDYAVPALEFVRNTNRELFSGMPGALLMENLLIEHETFPVTYGKEKPSKASVIFHTTDTLSGMNKTISMSDMELNESAACLIEEKKTDEDLKKAPDHKVSCLSLNMSWACSMVDLLHTPLSLGMEIVCLPAGGFNPGYADVIDSIPEDIIELTPEMYSLALSKYFTPIMKGENKMKKKKRAFNGFMPMLQDGKLPKPPKPPVFPIPPMPFAPYGNAWGCGENQKNHKDNDAQQDNYKSMMKNFMEQNIDMQKTSVDNNKKQWNQFFDYMMDMQDTFSDAMPDEAYSLPFAQMPAISPKSLMKRVKEFQEMANEHFIEQADSFADFFIQGHQQFYDMVSSAMDSMDDAEDSETPDEEEAVEVVSDDQNV